MKVNIEVGEESLNQYEPLPVGWYEATVESAEDVVTNAGHTAVVVTFLITGKGRSVKNWYNLNNPKEDTRDIAEQEMANLARACGLLNVRETTEDFSGHSLVVKLEPDGSWNRVKGYRRSEKATKRPAPSNGGAGGEPPWPKRPES